MGLASGQKPGETMAEIPEKAITDGEGPPTPAAEVVATGAGAGDSAPFLGVEKDHPGDRFSSRQKAMVLAIASAAK